MGLQHYHLVNSQDPIDPYDVLQNTINIQNRLGLDKDALALHWYEWDTLGNQQNLFPDNNYCEANSSANFQNNDGRVCGFDTHYPEYFPVRVGFEEALQRMQQKGIRAIPYINGRILDTSTKTWTKDNSIAQKSTVLTNH